MLKSVVLLFACFILFNHTHAQLGGLIKKAKDKATEAKPEKTTKTEEPAPATPPAGNGQPVKTETAPPPPAAKKEPAPPAERRLMWPEGNVNRVSSDAPSSPLHDKYVRKLVFSAQQLTPENTKEPMFKTSFNIDEPIYARVYLATAVQNYILYSGNGTGTNEWDNREGECSLKYTVDDKDTVYVLKNYRRKGDTRSWITWQYFISARGENAEFNEERFVKHMNSLSDGEHTLHFKLWAGGVGDRWSIEPIATGDIKLNKLPGKKMSLGRGWSLYKAAMTNPAIEKEMIEVMKQKAARDGWKETFSKVKIIDKDWYVAKSEYTGLVLYRTINALLYAKWPDGHCTVQEFNFKQEWNGNAWSKILEFNGVGDQTVIDCE
ncbi:MAG: hypothetical protein NTW29_20600 [Bacteroidetes bacterium]|nr:hypothetical protein [Bacteroidota bacterium]